MIFDAAFFVALSFVLVMCGFLWLKLPARVVSVLDARAADIKKELDEAVALRREATEILADYELRTKDVEKETAGLVKQAQEDAERIAAENTIALQQKLKRRTEQLEEKIARAEGQLIEEIRHATVGLATQASAMLIAKELTASQADKLINNTIDGLEGNVH